MNNNMIDGSMIVLYGAGPVFPDRWFDRDGFTLPYIVPDRDDLVSPPLAPQPSPLLVPETAEQLRARLEERCKWLERELKILKAYEHELGLLRAMLAATPKHEGLA